MGEQLAERTVTEFAGEIDPQNVSSLVFDLSKYQVFSKDLATVVYTYITGELGIVVWNLEPGQENEYHMHPAVEHLHIVFDGECEYTVGDLPPVRVGVGQAVMVPAKVAHGIRNVGTVRASYIAITSPGPYEKVLIPRSAAAP
jgi:quercetin dioxygenase-like cupin family protein